MANAVQKLEGTFHSPWLLPEQRLDLSAAAGHSFPLLTTKRVFWRGVVEELLWCKPEFACLENSIFAPLSFHRTVFGPL